MKKFGNFFILFFFGFEHFSRKKKSDEIYDTKLLKINRETSVSLTISSFYNNYFKNVNATFNNYIINHTYLGHINE
jgi:hypothetical protein